MRTTATSKVRAARHTVIAAVALTLGVLAAVPAMATTVVSSGGVEGRYSHSEYSAAADGKEFLVEVRGVPFAGIPQATFNRALMNVLNATRPSQPATNFTVQPTGGSAESSYRLVIIFGPSRNLAFQDLCRTPDAARFEPVRAGQVTVSVAFCRNGELLSHAIASARAADVSDPAFGMMFAALLPVVFPRDNPSLNSGS